MLCSRSVAPLAAGSADGWGRGELPGKTLMLPAVALSLVVCATIAGQLAPDRPVDLRQGISCNEPLVQLKLTRMRSGARDLYRWALPRV